MGVVALALTVVGCAGLMMDVKDVDEQNKGVTLSAGDQVVIAAPDVKTIEEDFSKEDAAKLATMMKSALAKEFADEKVAVADSGDTVVKVKITNYRRGCGFCRGFFPVFGLGDSAVDGEVELDAHGQKRRLVVEKTGQASGMSQMGDQTKTNVDYFATVVVGRLTKTEK
jgi:hypothetical protein